MATARYSVGVYDRAGEYSTTSCTDFAHLLQVVAIMRKAYPDKIVQACNLDNVDLGWHDGLTEDERDAVDCVGVQP